MNKLLSFLLLVLSPGLAIGQCHHFSGGHFHASHSFHPHTTQIHISHAHYYHSPRSHAYRQAAVSPLHVALKGDGELAAGTGAASGTQLVDPSIYLATPTYWGTFRYFISNRIAVDVTGGIQTLQGRDTCHCIMPGNSASDIPYNYRALDLTLAAGISWLYYSKPAFQAYGGLSAGISHFIETDYYPGSSSSAQANRFNMQATVAGIRFGRTLAGFVEVGYGYKGLVSAGLSYQPGRQHIREL